MSRLFARPKVLLAALAAAGLSFLPAAPEKAEAGPRRLWWRTACRWRWCRTARSA